MSKKVIVIFDNKNLGLMEIDAAADLAERSLMDLVKVDTSKEGHEIFKVMNYGKYKYKMEKSKKQNKERRKITKEVRVGASIGAHDLDVKVRSIQKFLKEGKNVRVTMRFNKGLKRQLSSVAETILEKIEDEISDLGTLEVSKRDSEDMFFDTYSPNK